MEYDRVNKPMSSSEWIAEWSEAPPIPPREVGGAGTDPAAAANVFFVL